MKAFNYITFFTQRLKSFLNLIMVTKSIVIVIELIGFPKGNMKDIGNYFRIYKATLNLPLRS